MCYVSDEKVEWKENGKIVKSFDIEMPDGKLLSL